MMFAKIKNVHLWIKCRTWGYRYAPPGKYKEVLMIYDVNGFITGMQSIVPKEDTYDDKFFRFSTSDMYNFDVVNRMEVNDIFGAD